MSAVIVGPVIFRCLHAQHIGIGEGGIMNITDLSAEQRRLRVAMVDETGQDEPVLKPEQLAGRSSELVRLVHPVGTQFRRPGTVARFRVF